MQKNDSYARVLNMGMTNYRNGPTTDRSGVVFHYSGLCFGQGCPFWDILRHIRAITLTLTPNPSPNPNPIQSQIRNAIVAIDTFVVVHCG